MKKKDSAPTQKKTASIVNPKSVKLTALITDAIIMKIEKREKLTTKEKKFIKEPATFEIQVGEDWYTPFKILVSDEPRLRELCTTCTKNEIVDYNFFYWTVKGLRIKIERKVFWKWIALLRKEYKSKGMVLRGNKYPMMTGRLIYEPETIWNVNYLKRMNKAA